MKILWVCNIMLPMIAESLGLEASNKEGWLSGLLSEVLIRQSENQIELAVAFPVPAGFEGGEKHIYDGSVIWSGVCTDCANGLKWYAFSEDVVNPHIYDENLELQMWYITKVFQPDVVHCFGTEYPHTLALCRAFPDKARILVGIQGLCSLIAESYFADLPKGVIHSKTLRDVLRKDDLLNQQRKFALRGQLEQETVSLAGNITGRTAWDRENTLKWNPRAEYFDMNETLRSDFYHSEWKEADCEPHSIFLSQGDYPLKGLHYMLMALPVIREKYPDVKVYVAGNGITGEGGFKKRLKISAYGKYLRKLIRDNKLQDTVKFLGRLTAQEMKEQYLRSHLFVCCSSLENSPNSLGEAMLLGMPCVSADVGGVSSIFTGGKDGIVYRGKDLKSNAENLAKAVLEMWGDSSKMGEYCDNARKHALKTHDKETNYKRLVEIYTQIAMKEKKLEPVTTGQGESVEKQVVAEKPVIAFVSNYINHHQIPFCEAMYSCLKGGFAFIQTEKMEQERVAMGWQEQVERPYLMRYYEEPKRCKEIISDASVIIFGGVDDESYITERLQRGKPVIRYSERLYKEGQWKAVSPRGLLKKYKDHTRYRNADVYLLCAGAYVPSDFHIVRAYPGKMLKWGYFPETRHYDVDKLMADKKPATILWAARFLDWKHPETALQCANYLKGKGIAFQMRIVGDGQQRPLVDRLMAEYELSDCVTLMGYRNPEEVRALMEETDIYLTTSDRREGWGAVINEAMNSGCAVVADHMMGAAPYLIQHGENGFVYEDGRPEMCFELVEKLLSDRELVRKLGRKAIQTIEHEWNADTAAKRLLQFCELQGFVGREDISEEILPLDGNNSMPESGPGSVAEVISERKMICKLL